LGCPTAPGNHIPLRRDCYHLTQYADIFSELSRTPHSLALSYLAELLEFCSWLGNLEFGCLSDQRLAVTSSTYTPLASDTGQHAEIHHKKRAFVAPGRISGSLAGRFCCRGGSCATVFLFCVVEFSVRRIVQGVAQSLPRPRCRDAFPMKGVEQKL